MLFLQSLINYFMVPVICLLVKYRKKKDELKPSFILLLEYCAMVGVNISVTRVILFFANMLTTTEITGETGQYTIYAIASAILMAIFIEIYENSKDEISKERNSNDD